MKLYNFIVFGVIYNFFKKVLISAFMMFPSFNKILIFLIFLILIYNPSIILFTSIIINILAFVEASIFISSDFDNKYIKVKTKSLEEMYPLPGIIYILFCNLIFNIVETRLKKNYFSFSSLIIFFIKILITIIFNISWLLIHWVLLLFKMSKYDDIKSFLLDFIPDESNYNKQIVYYNNEWRFNGNDWYKFMEKWSKILNYTDYRNLMSKVIESYKMSECKKRSIAYQLCKFKDDKRGGVHFAPKNVAEEPLHMTTESERLIDLKYYDKDAFLTGIEHYNDPNLTAAFILNKHGQLIMFKHKPIFFKPAKNVYEAMGKDDKLDLDKYSQDFKNYYLIHCNEIDNIINSGAFESLLPFHKLEFIKDYKEMTGKEEYYKPLFDIYT